MSETPVLITDCFTSFLWQSIRILVHSLSQGNEFMIYGSVHIQETHQLTHHTLERVVSHSLRTQMMEVATGTTVVFVLVHTCKPMFQHVWWFLNVVVGFVEAVPWPLGTVRPVYRTGVSLLSRERLLYRMIQEESALLWEMIVWVILSKKVHTNMGPILNGYGVMTAWNLE